MKANCEKARSQYLVDYPEVKNITMDSAKHYINSGAKEGKKWRNELCFQPESVYSIIKHKATGRCLDGNGNNLYFGDCNKDNPYQNWKPEPTTDGYNNIRHSKTNKCIDGNGNNLYFGDCNKDNSYQNWKLIPAENGFFNYQHKASGKCLDGNGGNLYFGNCESGNYYQNYSSTTIFDPIPVPDPVPVPVPVPVPDPVPVPVPSKLNQPDNRKFVINDESLYTDKQLLTTDLYTADIYLKDFEKTQMNGGYIKIPYFMPSSVLRHNATYIEDLAVKKYKCRNLYIFKATHNITMDAKFDAELVIQLIPTVNTEETLYLCFLLKNIRYVNEEPNDIDKIINTSIKPPSYYDTMKFELQKLIEPQQKKIIYKSSVDTIVIFLSPISINEVDFSKYATIPIELFSIYPTVDKNYKIVLPKQIEGFTEGEESGQEANSTLIDQDDVNSEITNALNKNLLTCELVDDNDQSLVTDNTATYIVDGKKNSASSQNALGTALIIMLVAIGSSYLGAPLFFKYTVSNYITKDESLSVFSYFITAIMFLLGLILLLGGNKYDPDEMWVGVFIIIFLLLSVLSIELSRSLKVEGAILLGITETIDAIKPTFNAFSTSFFGKKNDPSKTDSWFFISYVVIYFILVIVLFITAANLKIDENKSNKYKDHVKGLIVLIGSTYGAIFLAWIMMLFKYS
jgi:hypothetical protein